MSILTEERKVVLLPGQLEELLEMWQPRMFTAAAGRFVAACRDQRNGCLHRTTGDKNSLNVLRASRTTSDHSPAARSDRRLRGLSCSSGAGTSKQIH